MAASVNTRFVIILAVVLAVLVGGIGVVSYWVMRRDPGRYIAQAEALIGEDNYRDALTQYGRAYAREDDNARKVQILLDMAKTAQQIEPIDTTDAQQLFLKVRQYWSKAVDLDPSNVEAAEKLLTLYQRQAEMRDALPQWVQLHTAADELLKFAPDNRLATRYRGIANVVQINRRGLGPGAREQARKDLQSTVDHDPDDALANYYLARLDLIEADEAESTNRFDRAQELREQARQRVDRFVESHPQDVEGRLCQFRLVLQLGRDLEDTDVVNEARAMLDDIEQQLLNADLPRLTLEVASRVVDMSRLPVDDEADPQLQMDDGLERAAALLTHTTRNHPDDVAALVALGTIHVRQRDMNAAIERFEQARKDRPIPVSLDAYRIGQYQVLATQKLADVYLSRHEMSSDPNQREQDLAEAQRMIEDLETSAGEDSAITLWMQGKLALIQDRPAQAVKKLEQADTKYEGENVEALLLLALAYKQTGLTGAAADALTRLIENPQGAGMLRPNLELAELRIADRDYAGAERIVDRVLRAAPDNAQARMLKGRIELQRAAEGGLSREQMVERAIARFAPLAEEGDRSAVLQLARLHRTAGDLDAARRLLAGYQQDHPQDLAIVQERVRVEQAAGDPNAAADVVEAALEEQPDNKMLNLLLTTIRDRESVGDELERLIGEQEDPVQRALSYWRYYRRAGEPEKAEAALQQAIDQAPDDERVMEIRFERALAEEDFSAAEQIVEQAGAMNDGEGLDYAGGAFWEGRLQMARGNFSEAARTLEAGLEEMPSNARAHLLLGRCRYEGGDMSGAERAVRRAVELKPDSADAWRQLYLVHDRMQSYDQALDDLRRALAITPNDAGLYMTYLDYMGRHGDRNAAIEARERIAESNPSAHANRRELVRLYLDTDQYDKARRQLESLLAEDPDAIANVSAMASYHAETGDYARGLQMLRDVIEDKGEQATMEDWLIVARYLREGNDADAAMAAYSQAAALEQSDQRAATREWGDWLFATGRFEQAAEQYSKVLDGEAVGSDERARVWRRYVETLVNAGQLDRASEELGQLMKAHGAEAQTHMIEAMIARRRLAANPDLSEARRNELREQAAAALDQAVVGAPQSAMPYFQRAAFRYNRDSELIQQMVRDDLQRAIELDSRFALPRQMLIQWYMQRGELGAAVEELQRFITAMPGNIAAREQLAELLLSQRRFTELDSLLNDSLQALPGSQARWYAMQARMYDAQGRKAEARDALARAYENERSVGRAIEYATQLLNTRQHEQAAQVLQQWPDQLTSNAVMQAMQGRIHYAAGREEAGRAAFERALDMAGADPQPLNALQGHMRSVLQPGEVIAMLQPRVQRDSSGQMALLLAQYHMMAGQVDQAMQTLQAIGGQFSNRDYLESVRQRLLARGHYVRKDYQAAQRAYETVIELRPNDVMSLNNLAYMLANDMDKPDAALSLAERALELAGDNPAQRANVLDTVGWVHYCNNNYRDAEQTLERSIRLKPMAVNHLHMAKVFLAQDRPIPAREQLIAARELVEDEEDQSVGEEIERLLESLNSAAANLER